jgi:hypothetical protein
MKNTALIFSVLILILMMFSPDITLAQPPPPAMEPTQAPLGGIELLLFGGAAYGIKRLKTKQKEEDIM